MKISLTHALGWLSIIAAIFFHIVFPAYGQDHGTADIDTMVDIDFGKSIRFSILISSEVEPVRAVLFLRTSPLEQYETYITPIEKLDTVSATLQVDPQSLHLLPFSAIYFYWQVDMSDGSVSTSNPEQFTYLDTRYEWQVLSREGITIHWVEGDTSWGQDLYAIANSALPEIQRLFATSTTLDHHIYVYPDQAALQNSLRLAGINQAAAHALPELGVALVAGRSDPETLIRFEQEIPHELVHLLLFERMGPEMDNLPIWLNEGLATVFEHSPRPIYTTLLEEASANDTLIPMGSLCTSFPIGERDRFLAYAQSASFTNYLIDIYGTGGILRLLDAYEEGTTCQGGIQRVYQRSIGQLESEWISTTFGKSEWVDMNDIKPIALLALAAILAAASVAWLIRKRDRTSQH